MKSCLISIVIISCVAFSDACSCYLPKGWQWDAIANSAYVGTFKVTGAAVSCGPMKVCYPIIPIQQFRGPPVSPTILETNSDSAACGVWLEIGRIYFVATNPVSSSRIGVYLCGLLEDWTDKTCCEMIAIAKEYTGPKPEDPIIKPIDPIPEPITEPIPEPIPDPIPCAITDPEPCPGLQVEEVSVSVHIKGSICE